MLLHVSSVIPNARGRGKPYIAESSPVVELDRIEWNPENLRGCTLGDILVTQYDDR